MTQQLACILLVTNKDESCRTLKDALETDHYHVTAVHRAMQAHDAINKAKFDIAIMDMCLPDGDGIDLLNEVKRMDNNVKVIMMITQDDADLADDLLQAGANDLIYKPVAADELLVCVAHLSEKTMPMHDKRHAKKVVTKAHGESGMIGQCAALEKIRQIVSVLGVSDSSVLITGESGTGKEVIAKLLHTTGSRSDKPFVPINCGAIPEELLESELFGHMKGAFTGAIRNMPGRFEMANGGVIFLDEIGDMSPKLQVKLLRVLQERVFTPVGSSREMKVDVQVLAATHRDLEEEIKAGRFREDLFYRLNVIPIQIPPLRERGNDILLLAEHYIAYFNKTKNASISGLLETSKKAMLQYDWPGNVRELRNVMERISILKHSGMVENEDLPSKLLGSGERIMQNMDVDLLQENCMDLKAMVNEFENNLIVSALNRFQWNKNKAAKFLLLNRTTLVEKIKKKGLAPNGMEEDWA